MHNKLSAIVRTTTAAVQIMVSLQLCVIWLAKNKTILTVQHNFHHMYGRDTRVSKVIQCWFNQFKESGSVEKQKSPGGLQTSDDDDDECMTLSCHCPKKSTALQSLQLDVPTISKSFNKNKIKKQNRALTYKFQILHEIKKHGHGSGEFAN
jgi:hypothetical protein